MTKYINTAFGLAPAAVGLVNEDSGVLSPMTDVEQMSVLLEAFLIFQERNAKRADLWKRFGWQDSALHLRSKAMRVSLALDGQLDIDPEDVLDDAVDIINYAAFFIRNVRNPS